MLLALFVINKSGGVVYHQELSPAAPALNSNEWLRLGSTFHGLHGIYEQVVPVKGAGIESLETDRLLMKSLQSKTGVKFVLSATAGTGELDSVLAAVHSAYADFVLKDPFYELEMPIRQPLFSENVKAIVERHGGGGVKRSASKYMGFAG
jgi:hypothetical protein